MTKEYLRIGNIPACIWGEPSEKVWLFVHGKMSGKEAAAGLAAIAGERGWQTLSFDLPEHGERIGQPDRCEIHNGIRDLTLIADYAFAHWQKVSLYGCSLGAYFSLNAYPDRPFQSCLFQSPILDMEHLIRKMMLWFDITLERLEREREIPTPIDTMSWEYYRYVLSHPVTRWNIPTGILYGGRDDLQSREVIEAFSDRFGCKLTVSEASEHPFMKPEDAPIVETWLKESIL